MTISLNLIFYLFFPQDTCTSLRDTITARSQWIWWGLRNSLSTWFGQSSGPEWILWDTEHTVSRMFPPEIPAVFVLTTASEDHSLTRRPTLTTSQRRCPNLREARTVLMELTRQQNLTRRSSLPFAQELASPAPLHSQATGRAQVCKPGRRVAITEDTLIINWYWSMVYSSINEHITKYRQVVEENKQSERKAASQTSRTHDLKHY